MEGGDVALGFLSLGVPGVIPLFRSMEGHGGRIFRCILFCFLLLSSIPYMVEGVVGQCADVGMWRACICAADGQTDIQAGF
jgi:hypothetical protein